MTDKAMTHDALRDDSFTESMPIVVNVKTGCWLWSRRKNSNGYARWGRVPFRNAQAHRIVWERYNGPIATGLTLDHLCRVRHCVNPRHLEPVTTRENVLRGVGISAVHARKTRCVNGHPFDADNTRHLKHKNGRDCRACHRARWWRLDDAQRRRKR